MRLIRTSVDYNGYDKLFYMVENTALAEMLERSTFQDVIIENVTTTSQYWSEIAPYVGDIHEMAFPFCADYWENPERAEWINLLLSLYPNSYYVQAPSAGSYTQINDCYTFGDKKTGLSVAGWAVYGMCFSGSDNGFTALLHGSIIVNNTQTVRVFLPVFKESELENDTLHSLNRYMGTISITWDTGTHRLTIGRQQRFSGDNINYFANSPIPIVPEGTPDPYVPSGGSSGAGGGPAPSGGTGATGTGGLHDDTSDAIPTPSLPSSVAIGSGLFTAYNPSASQLAYFADKLWNMQPTDINDVLRFLFGGDAFNAIIGLHLLPVQPDTSGSPNIMLGNWDSGAQAPKIVNQYKQVPFGSLMLPEYWGNCIDYAPYTKIQLALPYIGIVDVDTDDVLGSNNTLTYNIDVLSGAICATLHCVKGNLNSVIYQWSGACAVSLPFSGASYNSVLGAIAGIAAAGMGFASMAAGPIGAALPAAALAAGGGAFGAGSAASIMGTMKGKVQKSGSFGANSGALGIMTPYFILTRPVQSVPETWQADKGYPANISAQLGTLLGYTEVSEINLECSGTEAEKREIIELLKKGVLF